MRTSCADAPTIPRSVSTTTMATTTCYRHPPQTASFRHVWLRLHYNNGNYNMLQTPTSNRFIQTCMAPSPLQQWQLQHATDTHLKPLHSDMYGSVSSTTMATTTCYRHPPQTASFRHVWLRFLYNNGNYNMLQTPTSNRFIQTCMAPFPLQQWQLQHATDTHLKPLHSVHVWLRFLYNNGNYNMLQTPTCHYIWLRIPTWHPTVWLQCLQVVLLSRSVYLFTDVSSDFQSFALFEVQREEHRPRSTIWLVRTCVPDA